MSVTRPPNHSDPEADVLPVCRPWGQIGLAILIILATYLFEATVYTSTRAMAPTYRMLLMVLPEEIFLIWVSVARARYLSCGDWVGGLGAGPMR